MTDSIIEKPILTTKLLIQHLQELPQDSEIAIIIDGVPMTIPICSIAAATANAQLMDGARCESDIKRAELVLFVIDKDIVASAFAHLMHIQNTEVLEKIAGHSKIGETIC